LVVNDNKLPSVHLDRISQVVIVSKEDLSLLEVPCVAQQYHDHGAVLYKVYVIDSDVMVFRRRSLPNLYCSGTAGAGGACTAERCRKLRSVAFDSRKSYPTYRAFLCERCAAADQQGTEQAEAGAGTASTAEPIPAHLLGKSRSRVS
jgi:hypothetical protein